MVFVYDLQLKRPGAPIIQMMHGGNVLACKRFPEYLWLYFPSPTLTVHQVKPEDLDELVRLTLEYNSGA